VTRRAAAVVAGLAVLLVGCPGSRKKAPAAVPVPPPVAVTIPQPPPPPPGEKEMGEARASMRRGNLALATSQLQAVVAMEPMSPVRGEALFALAVVESLEQNPSRDTVRAREHLGLLMNSGEPPDRVQAAALLFALLEQEEALNQEIEDLRSQVQAAKGDAEILSSTLAQREEELRKIKEILLEKSPGS